MPVTISRLRHWFAVAAITAATTVAGVYFYARHRVQNALQQVPAKIGAGIQQSAQGYTYSQSDHGRTIFKIQASKALFKLDGRAELQNVAITLYGRDASRFDQIYGSDFEYDAHSGDVTAQGKVQIDLEANPAGLTSPDQSPPKELKNPIHLETSGLVFNQKTGDAHTKERVDFRISQAVGSAVGVSYISKSDSLVLDSQVEIALAGPNAAMVKAAHGTITKDPRVVALQSVHMQQGTRRGQADDATLFLSPDNALERVQATGNVHVEIAGAEPTQLQADQIELVLSGQSSAHPGGFAQSGFVQSGDAQGSQLQTATFSGNVKMASAGNSPVQGSAGRMIASFSGKSVLNKVHAEENVRLLQAQEPTKPADQSQSQAQKTQNKAQNVELTASALDFYVTAGKRLTHANTFGRAQINVRPVAPNAGQTIVTAAKFTAQFDALGQLASVHGAPDARIVDQNPGKPDRVSTSQQVDASFAPGQGMETAVQQGNVVLSDGERKAWADRAYYTPANQMLELSGSPRLLDQNMATTARIVRMNRATGEGFAEGDVKTTYSDLKPQPGGALLSSSSPIHVTASAMTARRNPAIALYTRGARLWQDANLIAAPSIEFDRDHRSILAKGTASQPVSTTLIDTGKHDKVVPTIVTAQELTYVDIQRRAHYAGGVTAKSPDFTLTSEQMDVFLQPQKQQSSGGSAASPASENPKPNQAGQLDHLVGQGQVLVTQPTRRATGDKLVYTAADQKFVLTGGPPSIFDAERGKITGVSLTLFRGDDRVLVEGSNTSPSVTQTRVAR
jgi:lipopolysaccharide export system protein LptA